MSMTPVPAALRPRWFCLAIGLMHGVIPAVITILLYTQASTFVFDPFQDRVDMTLVHGDLKLIIDDLARDTATGYVVCVSLVWVALFTKSLDVFVVMTKLSLLFMFSAMSYRVIQLAFTGFVNPPPVIIDSVISVLWCWMYFVHLPKFASGYDLKEKTAKQK